MSYFPLEFWKVLQIKMHRFQLKLLVPEHASCSNCQWLYSITYGGGLVENDDIQLNVVVEEECCVMMTTQSSTKVNEIFIYSP